MRPTVGGMAEKTWSIGSILVGRPTDRLSVDDLETLLFLDRGEARYKFQRFGLLLVLSAIIASGGIIVDSTATVIGAMIVAPLGVPIMGVALATVVSSAARLTAAIAGVVGGALGAALIGALMAALFVPETSDVLTNPQVAGRITPSVVDMVVALAVGVVAAVGMMRRDLSDVLPGVAIAISLVPPMCVVGITASETEWAAAAKALTLFATNVVAMIAAGILTFAAAKYATADSALRSLNSRRVTTMVGIALIALLIPLGVQSVEYQRLSRSQVAANEATQQWLAGTGWELEYANVSGNAIAVRILGTGQPPPVESLMSLLDASVASAYEVTVDAQQGESIKAGTTNPS